MPRAKFTIASLLIIIAILSITAVQLYSELTVLKIKYADLLREGNDQQSQLFDLRSRYSQLSQLYQGLANSTSPSGWQPFKKNWILAGKNVTLGHGDTLRLTVEINNDWFWGVDSIDRLEVAFVNAWSPDLRKESLGTGEMIVYVDDFLISRRPIVLPASPAVYSVPFPPVSRNESVIRESAVSYHFFFENWNFIHAGPPPIKIEFVYRALPEGGAHQRLSFMELELYVVGSVRIQGYQFPQVNFNTVAVKSQCLIIGPDKQVISTSCGTG